MLLVSVISLVDLASMYLLRSLHHTLPEFTVLLIESLTLLIVLFPAIYLLVVRPIARQNDALRRAEAALRESEYLYRLRVEHTPAVTYTMRAEANSRLCYISPQVEALLGYSAQTLLDDPALWQQRIHPEDRERVMRDIATSVQSGGSVSLRYRLLARDGRALWFRDDAHVIPDETGAPSLIQGVLIDETDQHAAEQEIVHLASFPRVNPNPVFEVDLTGTVSYANQSTYTALSAAGVAADPTLFFPVDIADMQRDFQTTPTKRFYREITLNDAVFALHIFFIPDIQITRVYVTDITRYKRAEAALRASEEHFRLIAETSIDAIFQVDRNGIITYFSPAAERIGGYPVKESIGIHFSHFMVPDEVSRVLEHFHRVLAGEVLKDFEILARRKDGQQITIQMNVGPIYRDGMITGVQGIFHDITTRKQSEEAMRLSRAVIDNTIEGVTITTPDGTIVSVNPAFTAITGYTAAEAVGHNPRVLKSERHDDAFYREMWQALRIHGHWQGEIWNRRKSGEAYPEWLTISAIRDDAGETTHYVAVFHDITESKQQQERIQYQAEHDALTGLPNRMLFRDRLAQALAHAKRGKGLLGVMLLDLDRFKSINDSLGHVVGDQLLQAVASRLPHCVRQDDTVARLGGDEFILLLTNLNHPDDAVRVAEKVMQAFQAPFLISERELYITPSIGIALAPSDADDTGTLIQYADVALYRAKEAGRNAFRLFAPAMNARALERLEMEAELRRAIEREEFRLVYQPRVDVSSGQITSVEALIRWEHPERGTILPGQFIPLAEETGLIAPIGEWVLRAASAQVKAWHAAGLPPLRIAVNVSGRQFATRNLVSLVTSIIADCQACASLLELEITESVAMANVAETLATLRQLHDMGFWIAIDDFGTSYSSLGYLKQFPIHALKIDQSFVREIPHDRNSGAIASAIIALAHSLQLQVIAEGVENAEQLEFLACQECDEVQGFYFSRPVPPEVLVQTFLVDGAFTARVPVA